ncbi:MAG: hypothetical protein P8L77_00290 [Gammaproteobacteria bacterium]|nr:hypothetical protein [Gammaproteobacteria bacterium]
MNINIAQSALNIVVLIYIIQLLPQLWRTASKASVSDLSTVMIRLIWVGWVMDVLYAKLAAMPVQYFVVSYLGLFQTMLWILLLRTRKFFSTKEFLSFFTVVICVVASPLKWVMKLKFLPILTIGQVCFWFCWISQLVRSLIQKSAQDISLLSMFLGAIGTVCSLVAGSVLGWEKQYIFNLMLVVFFHICILAVLAYYRFYPKQNTSL